MTVTVTAVVVTWNRRELLLESLAAVYDQTRVPDRVVVIDNASTDGTAQRIAETFPAVELTTLATNTGGAGGFAVGLDVALAGGTDAVWLMDDDTVPEPTALEELLRVREHAPAGTPALVASRVVWTDGRDHPMNTPRQRPLSRAADRAVATGLGCIAIRSASFVSILVDARAVDRTGLPRADYFLWNDDFEFTARLLRHGVGLYCPQSRVVHKTRTFGATDVDPGERFYFEVRNKIWMLGRSRALSPIERALYSVSTLRRWILTFARSKRRDVLRRALYQGVRAGLWSKPRATADVLADAGVTLRRAD